MLRYQFINYKIEISKEIVKMGTSFEDILNRMKNAPHNGIPKVTNPKVPTKVERDAAAFEARVAASPKVEFKSGSGLDQLLERMRNASHGGMVYADHAFNCNPGLSKAEVITLNKNIEAFMQGLRERKAKRKQEKLAGQMKQEETNAEE